MKCSLININKVNNYPQIKFFENNLTVNAQKKEHSTVKNNSIPANIYKANFCPVSFGQFKKIAEVQITDRQTDKPVNAALKVDTIGNNDFVMAKMYVGRKEVGYIEIACPVTDRSYNSSYNVLDRNTCEIEQLRSLAGDRYRGIGTELVKFAVLQSVKSGCEGRLCLYTDSAFDWSSSDYRAKQSPIPFYDKIGFTALNAEDRYHIKYCILDERYTHLEDTQMYLTDMARVHLIRDALETINFKEPFLK